MKIIYLDTETTGLNPEMHDVIQVAGIIEIDGIVKAEFDFKCQPHSFNNCEPSALKIHGFNLEQLRSFPLPRKSLKDLKAVWKKYVDPFDRKDKFMACGQNIDFDIRFLDSWFKKCGDTYFWAWIHYQKLDLLSASFLLQQAGIVAKTENFKLGTVCEAMDVPLNDAHNALADVRATRVCMHKYLEALRDLKAGIINLE
jgi:DNA polymerase-3 subunit epsilon